jgi:very-short-patch-repair endonuclease
LAASTRTPRTFANLLRLFSPTVVAGQLPIFTSVLMSDDIHKKLQASRKELLDIGLRNNLINFRKTTKNLTFVQGDTSAVFDALYVNEKSLGFGSTGRAVRKSELTRSNVQGGDREEGLAPTDLELLEELSVSGALAPDTRRAETDSARSGGRRASQVRLQTALDDERLFLQLLKIKLEAQTFIEEQGVNTLFVALGFLHWYEADSSVEARKAPLLLIPVSLERTSALEHFKLVYTGDDLVINLSLDAKLKTDFGIKLPQVDLDADLTPEDLEQYFAAVAKAVRMQKRWSIEQDELVLGFFSFAKLLMFQDLDPQSWPKEKSPAKHDVLTRLLARGFSDLEPKFAEDVNVDSVVEPGDIRFVKDADSSQTQAILEVRSGSNLVVQGPPGTGKSQTITNVIAELIAQNKTVLFVSEKMAALEVVKRRLDESHLGDAVLELHSQRATKTSVLKELARSLEQGKPLNGKGEQDIKNLKEVQESLNAYCEVVAAHVGNSGLPFLDVLGRYMKQKREWPALSPLAFKPMRLWTFDTFAERRDLLLQLGLQLNAMGRPDKNPYWGSLRTYFTPIEEASASDALNGSLGLLAQLQDIASSLSRRLMLSQPVTVQDVEVVCRAARRAEEAPKLQGVQLSTQDWQLRRDALFVLIRAGQSMSELRQKFAGLLIDAAWEQDLLPVRQALMTYGSKWWRFMSGEFKGAKRKLQAVAKGALPKEAESMLAMVDAVIDYQQHKRAYDPLESLGEALYGAQWQGNISDWMVLRRITEWVVALHDDLGKGNIPEGIVTFLSGNADASGLGEMVVSIERCVADLSNELSKVSVALGMEAQTKAGRLDMRMAPVIELATQLSGWKDGLLELYQLARFNALSEKLYQETLGEFADYSASCEQPQELVPLLELTWYAGLVESAYALHPILQRFDRVQHEHRIKRFRELDLASLRHSQTQLAAKVWEAKPNINQPGEMAVLRAELNKKRRHLPIRQLIHKAGRAIQQIKPVFMMSPMSIANFLPPGMIDFDVVIFDEASQVKAVDAFGAILRGKQVVVVGDTRQMPPTDFFGRDIDFDDEDNTTGDIESILSMFKAAGCWERYLRWHYRSRHESLIAVSNAEFYDNKLVIFPSSGANPAATGIRFDHLPEALYDRGRTRTNKGEAKAVAQAVMDHAIKTPQLSLGVAAFSVAQRDLIQIEVELLRRRMAEAEPFFIQHPNEPFFVKNLENIQGDERDVVFISIGYGRNESGKIAKEFGPLNKDGGHRRLNVLITRAKMAMRVFCNFKADDLELDASAKHGVRALKNFLKFAETRQLEVAHETGKAADSPFETEVIEALRDLGHNVEPQVGTAGYFIDMAIKDPDRPGRYLLAVECDGAAYHSSRSARDRDRLRQGVLEGLGWTFHRIWSTDWFRNRSQELGRVVDAIHAAKAGADQSAPTPLPAEPRVEHVITRDLTTLDAPAEFAKPYLKARLPAVTGRELHEADNATLAGLIQAVAAVESPVHVDEVAKRLMDAYGVSRAGSRITARLSEALQYAAAQRLIDVRGGFVYAIGGDPVQARDRSSFSSTERKIELVAPEEIDAALLDSVRLGFSLMPDAATAAAINLLGFGRATQRIAAVAEERLAQLTRAGLLVKSNGALTLPT